ncbi:MAG: PEGA domain-containing protein [Myxococcales bacterium]|nr:PEGA domain-containing protein [Myxococcales bacterium]
MTIRLTVSILALLLLSLWHGPANADTTAAKKAFEAGAQAYREGRYPDAVRHFLEAYEEDRQPALIYNAAQAYEKAGDVPNALRSYRRFLRLSPDADDRPTVELRVKNLEGRLRQQGVQQVSVFSTPSAAEVELDGKPAGKTPWSAEIAPGRHVIVLRQPGLPDLTKEFLLSAEQSLELDISLGKGSATPARSARGQPGSEPRGTSAEASADTGSPAQVGLITWAALGVGVVGLGTGLGFELARASAERDARDASTQLEHRERYDTMKSRQTTARVLTAVGAVGVTAGGVLLYFDLTRNRKRAAHRTRVLLACGATDCAVSARGSF